MTTFKIDTEKFDLAMRTLEVDQRLALRMVVIFDHVIDLYLYKNREELEFKNSNKYKKCIVALDYFELKGYLSVVHFAGRTLYTLDMPTARICPNCGLVENYSSTFDSKGGFCKYCDEYFYFKNYS